MRRFLRLLLAAFVLSAPAAWAHAAQAAAGTGLPPPNATQGAAAHHGLIVRNRPAARAPVGSDGYGRDYGVRPGSAFASGLLGGFLGAGLGGLLLGGGFFHGLHGGPGVLGVLLLFFLAYALAVWLYRRIAATVSRAGAGPGQAKPGFFGGGRKGRPITLTPADFQSFGDLLQCVQTAWSAQDMAALRSMTTPPMAASYAEQLAAQQARALRNQVSDVRLLQGDVVKAWSDGRTDRATVSMQFSMLDVTLDQFGRVVDGSRTERVTLTEYWSFVRGTRAQWVVEKISEDISK